MEPVNILEIASREELRRWYEENHAAAKEFWLPVNRGKERLAGVVDYLDAVEEALCFGWIDSTVKYIDGRALQRYTPRRNGGFWTQLNRERVRRLESLGLMTDAGRGAMPPDTFKMDKRVKAAFKKNPEAWEFFQSTHSLYQRVRLDSVQRHEELFESRLQHLIEQCAKGKMFGQWNDGGRLLTHKDKED